MADIGFGATCSYETTPGGGTYTALTGVTEVDIPSTEQEYVESTHLASSGRVRTFVKSMVMPKEFSFTIIYDETQFLALAAIQGVARLWKVIFPDASYAVCSGSLTNTGEVKFNVNALSTTNYKVKILGAVTYTSA